MNVFECNLNWSWMITGLIKSILNVYEVFTYSWLSAFLFEIQMNFEVLWMSLNVTWMYYECPWMYLNVFWKKIESNLNVSLMFMNVIWMCVECIMNVL